MTKHPITWHEPGPEYQISPYHPMARPQTTQNPSIWDDITHGRNIWNQPMFPSIGGLRPFPDIKPVFPTIA